MSLHTQISCKECGWKAENQWKNPKTAYLVLPAVVFFLLYRYSAFDFDKAIAGESILQINILVYMAAMIAIPLVHIVLTLFSNLKINSSVPEKCPECESGDLEISGSVK